VCVCECVRIMIWLSQREEIWRGSKQGYFISRMMAVEGGKRLKKKRTGTWCGKGERGRRTGIIASGF